MLTSSRVLLITHGSIIWAGARVGVTVAVGIGISLIGSSEDVIAYREDVPRTDNQVPLIINRCSMDPDF